MAIRITRQIRDDIVFRAMMATFDPRRAALIAAENALALECYNHVYGKDVAAVSKLGRDWFWNAGHMDFNCSGPKIRLNFETAMKVKELQRYGSRSELISDRDLSDRVLAHADQREKLKKEREAAEAALHVLVQSCGTVKRLGETWPEGFEFYKHIKDDNPPKLPTLQVGTVNAMLGLPKGA